MTLLPDSPSLRMATTSYGMGSVFGIICSDFSVLPSMLTRMRSEKGKFILLFYVGGVWGHHSGYVRE